MDPILEKFTRCPKCRAFSIRRADSDGKKGRYICDNCQYKFSLENTIAQEPVETLHIEEGKKSKKGILFILPIIIVIIGIFLIINITKRKQNQVVSLQSEIQKTESMTSKEPIGTKTQDVKNGDVLEVEQNKEDSSDLLIQQVKKKEKKEPSIDIIDGKGENLLSKKIFDLSYLKIRKSHPNGTSESFRWAYSKEVIVIKRKDNQQVFIAGDATGKRKWLVDDQIVVNGERITGFSSEVTEIGTVPEIKKLSPLDITYLIPANRDVTLRIQLVDLGMFWGNTDIYLVVK